MFIIPSSSKSKYRSSNIQLPLLKGDYRPSSMCTNYTFPPTGNVVKFPNDPNLIICSPLGTPNTRNRLLCHCVICIDCVCKLYKNFDMSHYK